MTDTEYVYIGDGVYAKISTDRGIILQTMRGDESHVIYLNLEMLEEIKKLVALATKLP
jgi:hypothetical protein